MSDLQDINDTREFRIPDWLDHAARHYWKKLVNRVDETQYEALAVLCDSFARYRQASDEIKRNGFTIASANGAEKANPATNALNNANNSIAKFWKLLRLDNESDESNSELEEFFN
ncbi:MAG: phage terminase small subunit P27 family [Planctomycetaceae bacterium]|nr:phage terminase small subunit P27 family [Planctomycetaceae bacterium]